MRSARAVATSISMLALIVLLASFAGATNSKASNRAGGTLTIASPEDLVSADNIQIRVDTDRLLMGSTVFEPLFTSGPQGQLTPALAKKAVPSHSDKVWTFTLQGGVKFQDGKPFTANDVRANFMAIFNPKNASDLAGDFGNIAKVQVVAPLTARFVLKEPDNAFPASVTDTAFIGDMAARAKMGASAWAQHPIGTGPYEWGSHTVGDSITFNRFDGYWRGRPPLDKVVFKFIADPQVATLALRHGDVDVLTNEEISTPALPGLRKDFRVIGKASNTWYGIFLNFGQPRAGTYQDTLAFHQGLAYLFDAQKVVPKIIGEYGEYADQLFPPWQAGHDPKLKPFPYNPQKGIQLLTKAGFPLGSTLKFDVATAPFLCQIATVIQSTITRLGYKVKLTCSANQTEGNGPTYNSDVLFSRDSGRATASTFLNDRWRKSLATAHDDKFTFENDQLESIVNSIPKQPTAAKAAALARRASDLIIHDQAAAIPLYWAKTWVVASKRVHGLELSPLGWQSMLMNSYTTVTIGS